MKRLLITNNPLVSEKYGSAEFIDCYGYEGVLLKARDMIHKGWTLETHPLMGSVKPNETPYKSVLLRYDGGLDDESLIIIESALERYKHFNDTKPIPDWPESVLKDFQVVDLDLISSIPIDLGGI